MASNAVATSPAEAFFATLSNAQRQALADMTHLPDDERAGFGEFLISAADKHCAPVINSSKRKLEEGTGPAFTAFAKRAAEFGYISQQVCHVRI